MNFLISWFDEENHLFLLTIKFRFFRILLPFTICFNKEVSKNNSILALFLNSMNLFLKEWHKNQLFFPNYLAIHFYFFIVPTEFAIILFFLIFYFLVNGIPNICNSSLCSFWLQEYVKCYYFSEQVKKNMKTKSDNW